MFPNFLKIVEKYRSFVGFLFILVLGLTPLLWFKDGYFIAGGDEFSLLNPGAFTASFKYVWNDKLPNAGGLLLAVPKLVPKLIFWSGLESLGLSLLLIERLWLVLLFLLPGLGMFIFMSKIYNKTWAKIVSSVFYMFNLFVLVSGPFQDNVKPVLAALPLTLFFWLRGLSGNKGNYLKYAILISLSSFIYSGSNVNPPSVAAIPITLILYFAFYVLTERRKFLVSLEFAFMTAVLYVLVNSWWLFNFVANIIGESENIKKVATFSALGTGAITDFFRLLGSWGWHSSHYRMSYFPFARYYDEPFLLVLSFLIPLLVFLAVLFKRRDRLVVFFGVLAMLGLFLSKGTAEPLGFLYQWLWENVPGLWVFREPFSKFSPITLFAYSVLIGFAVEILRGRWKNWREGRSGVYKLVSPSLIPFFVVLVILMVAYPLINGEVIWRYWNGSMRSYHVKIPDYWQNLKEWFDHNDTVGRIFLSPRGGYGVAYNWPSGFSTADAPAVLMVKNHVLRLSSPMSLADGVVRLAYEAESYGRGAEFARLLSLLNSKYVLQENDLDWRYTPGAVPPRSSNQLLGGYFEKLADFGFFDETYLSGVSNEEPNRVLRESLVKELLGQPAVVLYKMQDKDYLPRFFIPEKVIYASGDYSILSEAVSFGDYTPRSGIYLYDKNTRGAEDISNIETADASFLEPEAIDLVENNPLRSVEEDRFVMPNTSVLPDSPFYFLVTWKESRLLDGERDDLSKADLKLWLSSKRLMEIEKLVDSGKVVEAGKVFDNYFERLKDLVLNLELFSKERPDSYFLITKANLYFMKHKSILQSLQSKLISTDQQVKISEIYSLFRNISSLMTQGHFQYYLINKPTEGYYNIFIREKQGNSGEAAKYLEELTFVFDKNKVSTVSGEKIENGWYRYPEIYLDSNSHELSLPRVGTPNLISDGSFEHRSENGDSGLEFSSDSVEGGSSLKIVAEKYLSREVNWKLSGLQRGTTYRVSFSYKTILGSPLRFSVWQESSFKIRSSGGGEVTAPLFMFGKELDRDTTWQNFEKEITWESSDSEGRLVFLLPISSDKGVSLVDDLRFERVSDLKILLRAKDIDRKPSKTIPKVAFERMSPTKYRVSIREATKPYTLIFSESFNRSWKAFIPEPEPEGVSYKSISRMTKSYFNGDIMEVSSKDSFLDRNLMETWFKRPIPENRHHLVNGFANSWFIIPGDSGGRADYDIIIEFLPQRLFYLGITVSLITVVFCLFYLAGSVLKGRQR